MHASNEHHQWETENLCFMGKIEGKEKRRAKAETLEMLESRLTNYTVDKKKTIDGNHLMAITRDTKHGKPCSPTTQSDNAFK